MTTHPAREALRQARKDEDRRRELEAARRDLAAAADARDKALALLEAALGLLNTPGGAAPRDWRMWAWRAQTHLRSARKSTSRTLPESSSQGQGEGP